VGARASGQERKILDGYRFVRRMVAVAYADVVGYSRLMGADEEGTVARWLAIRRDVLEPKARVHRGRLVNAIGDSVLLEFPGVLDAVAWSREVQAILAARNVAYAGERKFQLRVAVHVCEVFDESADIYGEGVIIAARLQAHAPPGGVVVTEAAHDVLRVAVDAETQSLGPLLLKNVQAPVYGFLLDPREHAGLPQPEAQRAALPSIAVLPLRDLAADVSNNYFGDGIVEDIVVSLSGLRELMVISRGSTLSYGAQSDPLDVGQALRVRYVLSGTVRRSTSSVRVCVKLLDVRESACVWAENYSAGLAELFDVQDRIVGQIVAGIAPKVRAAELRRSMRKRPENFSAYDHTLRALELIHSLDARTFRSARGFLERAIAIDPDFAMPIAWLARWYSLWIGQGWTNQPSTDADHGIGFAAKAIERDPQNALALATFGHLKSFLYHDYDVASMYLTRAREACPNSALAWTLSSGTASYLALGEEAIAFAERGLRLSPQDRSLFYSYFFLGLAHYSAGNYEEAVRWCRMSHSENPFYTANLRILGAALAGAGDACRCPDVVQSLLRLEPGFRLCDYAGTRQPFREAALRDRYLGHLQLAGFPG